MHFERLFPENARNLGDREHDFTTEPGQLRRWNLLPAGVAASALLRMLALAGLGRLQLQKLAQQSPLDLARRSDQPVCLEFVQIRHAPQERGPASPVRRHVGWCVDAGGQWGVLAMKSMENYYRWLAVQYAAQRGRIHQRLVETLFRYNSRARMGGFLHRLEECIAKS